VKKCILLVICINVGGCLKEDRPQNVRLCDSVQWIENVNRSEHPLNEGDRIVWHNQGRIVNALVVAVFDTDGDSNRANIHFMEIE
jgi:hypothetical protein